MKKNYSAEEIINITNNMAYFPLAKERNRFKEIENLKILMEHFIKNKEENKVESLVSLFNLSVKNVEKQYQDIFHNDFIFLGYELEVEMPQKIKDLLQNMVNKLNYSKEPNKKTYDNIVEELTK